MLQAAVETPKTPLEKLFSKLPKLGRGGAKEGEEGGPSSSPGSVTDLHPAALPQPDAVPATHTGAAFPYCCHHNHIHQTFVSADDCPAVLYSAISCCKRLPTAGILPCTPCDMEVLVTWKCGVDCHDKGKPADPIGM